MGRREADLTLQEKTRHGEPGFPMVVYYNDFTSYVAQMIPWHWHEEVEFVVVTEGTVQFSVGADVFLLKAGEGIFINANTLHHMVPEGKAPAYMFSILANPGIFGIEQGVLLSSKYVTPYVTDEGLRYEILRPENEWEKECLKRLSLICETYMEKQFGYEYVLHNLICEVWFSLVRETFQHRNHPSRSRRADEERIYEALQYIKDHFREELSLEDICGSLNISKSECCRCFRRNLRMTPFEYLMMYRIHMAAQILEKTGRTITEVALETGFHSNSYFGKLFKRYMNCTPAEYRREKQK